MREESADTFVRYFKRALRESEREFAFFLGAGCSLPEIPGAADLVEQWLPRLHDQQTGGNVPLERWFADEFPGHDRNNPAAAYAAVMRQLFWSREDRRQEIDRLTRNKDPGFAYAILAQLLGHPNYGPRCNLVLTTNFDDMVAEAFYVYSQQKPQVIAHDSLSEFGEAVMQRPTIIKLHGDASLEDREVADKHLEFSPGDRAILRKRLAGRAIVFIGYGGNDKGVGHFFNSLPRDFFAAGVYWVGDSIPPNDFGAWLGDNPHACQVQHRRFDELMLAVRRELALGHPDDQRVARLMHRYREAVADIRPAPGKPVKTVAEQIGFDDWWAVELEARRFVDTDPANADRIYRDGLEQFPDSADLLGNYALFLSDVLEDVDGAEQTFERALEADSSHVVNLSNFAVFLNEVRGDTHRAGNCYRRAIEVNPANAVMLGNYAVFLNDVLQDYDQADNYYQQAIAAGPDNAHNLGNYALFLQDVRKDNDLAEMYLQRAIKADPEDANNLGHYAMFLNVVRKNVELSDLHYRRAIAADTSHAANLGNYAVFLQDVIRDADLADFHYQRAVDSDPEHVINTGNYALFLHQVRRNAKKAGEFYERAIDLDPGNAVNLGNYALFLKDARGEPDLAEKYFRRAIDADPQHANNLGNYALFLNTVRHDPDGADLLFCRAIEAGPANAVNLGNYAVFLNEVRQDPDQAEVYFKRAITADPKNANHLGNYALFLKDYRDDADLADIYFQRAIEADLSHANNLGNYAQFLYAARRDLERAEQFYRRAIAADPSNADNLGNYALMLKGGKRDMDGAERYYRKAIDADPRNATIFGNYGVLLWHVRRDWDRAEAMFRRAIELDGSDTVSHGNLIGCLYAQGRRDDAEIEVQAFFATENWPQLTLEVQFYRYANGRSAFRSDVLAQLKTLIAAGIRAPGWDFATNIDRAAARGHPEPDLLQVLADVIAGDADSSSLDNFDHWRSVA